MILQNKKNFPENIETVKYAFLPTRMFINYGKDNDDLGELVWLEKYVQTKRKYRNVSGKVKYKTYAKQRLSTEFLKRLEN